MPNSTQEEKLRWLTPILEKRMKIKDMASVSPFSERAIKYWRIIILMFQLCRLPKAPNGTKMSFSLATQALRSVLKPIPN